MITTLCILHVLAAVAISMYVDTIKTLYINGDTLFSIGDNRYLHIAANGNETILKEDTDYEQR